MHSALLQSDLKVDVDQRRRCYFKYYCRSKFNSHMANLFAQTLSKYDDFKDKKL